MRMRVGRLATKIGSGKTPSGGADNYQTEGILFLRSQNVHDTGLALDNVVHIPDEIDNEMANTRVKPGDVLLNITGASLGRSCSVPSPFRSANVNQHVCIIRATDIRVSSFLAFAMKSKPVKAQIECSLTGAARDGLNFEQVADIVVPLPPLPEQKAIAAFLDRETGKIDALVEEQRRLIALLKEKRQAVISHAVTKGLDPTAPIKPSGIDWLGDIPAHWDLRRVKDLCKEIVDCKNRTPPSAEDGTYFVVRTSCTRNGRFDPLGGYWTDEASFMEWTRKGLPQTGDILISREAPMGEACLFPEGYRLCLGQRMMYLRPDPAIGDSRYILRSIYSAIGIEYVDHKKKGSTVGHLRVPEVHNFPILIPPIAEQQRIADFLDKETAKLDGLISEAETAINLLQERRSALISAAVTGKIDVRGLVPEMTEAA